MTCEACTLAESNLITGLYKAHCDGCKVRALANGRELFEAEKAGNFTPEYENAMKRMFGDEWKAFHPAVKAWKEKLRGKQC